MKNIYSECDVKKDAPKEEIKKQYINFCKKNHPDVGGDTKEFQEKQQYFAILLDDAKRKRYDDTGETKTEDKFSKIITLAISLFEALIQKNPDNFDESILDFKANVLNGINQSIKKNESEKESLNKFMERVKLKKGDNNPVLIHMDRKIKNLEIDIEKQINDKKDYDKVFEYINNNFLFENIEDEEENWGEYYTPQQSLRKNMDHRMKDILREHGL